MVDSSMGRTPTWTKYLKVKYLQKIVAYCSPRMRLDLIFLPQIVVSACSAKLGYNFVPRAKPISGWQYHFSDILRRKVFSGASAGMLIIMYQGARLAALMHSVSYGRGTAQVSCLLSL